ncbi:MAG: hypothetical protein IT184_06195 [Acidobacteria bacterium]|nr:hypothetical protein [Acidobacteriota bacterium]
MTRFVRFGLLTVALLLLPRAANADITAFWGFSPTPSTHAARGFALGISLLVVGFEGEYATLTEDPVKAAPGLTTGMVNGLIQTPTRLQLYVTAGGGFFRERAGTERETSIGTNVGGGLKFPVLGPLRVRVDYRIFRLRGAPVERTPTRFYVGANLAF